MIIGPLLKFHDERDILGWGRQRGLLSKYGVS